ncbi:MAG: hypothetical protein WC107_07460 [Patescibacteria group bacterium]
MKEPKVHIQRGNTKLGRTMNIALPPGITCAPGIPCYNDGCYGRRFYEFRQNCRDAWDENYRIMMNDRDLYFKFIHATVAISKPELFRWHVSGDIIDFPYLKQMVRLAHDNNDNNDTRFLCFTKRYDFLSLLGRHEAPENLSLVMSAWPGLELPEDLKHRFPVAYMRDKRKGKVSDQRIPKSVQECSGGCDKCGLCWNIKAGESTVFNRH